MVSDEKLDMRLYGSEALTRVGHWRGFWHHSVTAGDSLQFRALIREVTARRRQDGDSE